MVNQVVLITGILLVVLFAVAVFVWGHDAKASDIYGEGSSFLFPFFSIAFQIQDKRNRFRKSSLLIEREQQLMRQIKLIMPRESAQKQMIRFQCMRITWVLVCFLLGICFCVLLSISAVLHPLIRENAYIQRTEYGQGDREANLIVSTKDRKRKYQLIVKERAYSEQEVTDFFKQATALLPTLILGQNSSPELISYPLQLVKEIEGMPFRISWESSNYDVVGSDGTVRNDDLSEDVVVTLTAGLSYLEYRFYTTLNVVVKPRVYTAEELEMIEIEKALAAQQEASSDRHALYLPKQVVGMDQIHWEEEPYMDWVWVLMLTGLAAIAIYVTKGTEIEKQRKEREVQLAMDYCELINKLTLYMNAGMTLRNIFFKLMTEYEKHSGIRKQYLYEEITMTCHEMQTGVSEADAYENFGKRCGLRQYVRLTALLNQNMKKGSNNLLVSLQQESRDAFETRKNMARRLGEEAGTKVLGPMMLMLGVVLVMIMIPAYLSFGM